MTNELDNLLNKIKALEEELVEELQKQEEFSYQIRKRHVYFEKNIILRHKHYAKALLQYLRDAPFSPCRSSGPACLPR